jgi:hypothetical protein
MESTIRIMYVVVTVVLPITAMAAIVAIAIIIRNKRLRTRELHHFAVTHGFELLPDAPDGHLDRYRGFWSVSRNGSYSVNVIRGRHRGIEWEIFDHRQLRGGRRVSEYSPRGVVVARLPDAVLPAFRLRPENVLHKVLDLVGFRDIPTGSEDFDRRYRLSGKDEDVVRRLFHPGLIAYLSKLPNHSWQMQGDTIVIDRYGKLFSAAELPAMMKCIEGCIAELPEEFWLRGPAAERDKNDAVGSHATSTLAPSPLDPPKPARERFLVVGMALLGMVGVIILIANVFDDADTLKRAVPDDVRRQQLVQEIASGETELVKLDNKLKHLESQRQAQTAVSTEAKTTADGTVIPDVELITYEALKESIDKEHEKLEAHLVQLRTEQERLAN